MEIADTKLKISKNYDKVILNRLIFFSQWDFLLMSFIYHNHVTYQSKLSLKRMESNRKTDQKNCCKVVSSTSLLSTWTLMMVSKCSKNYVLIFYCHLSYT